MHGCCGGETSSVRLLGCVGSTGSGSRASRSLRSVSCIHPTGARNINAVPDVRPRCFCRASNIPRARPSCRLKPRRAQQQMLRDTFWLLLKSNCVFGANYVGAQTHTDNLTETEQQMERGGWRKRTGPSKRAGSAAHFSWLSLFFCFFYSNSLSNRCIKAKVFFRIEVGPTGATAPV